MTESCPRCQGIEVSELRRLNPDRENRVYRCRACGHLWSPKEAAAVGGSEIQSGPLRQWSRSYFIGGRPDDGGA